MSLHLLKRYKTTLDKHVSALHRGPDKSVLAHMLMLRDDSGKALLTLDDFRGRLGHLETHTILASLRRLEHKGLVTEVRTGTFSLSEKLL